MKTTSGQDALTTRPVAEVLRRALAIFGKNGEHWGKNGSHRCVLTALGAACGIGSNNPKTELFNHIRETAFDVRPVHIIKWNDAPERTFAEVKALFEKAISKVEAK